jgi:hypothetical protein
MKLAMEAWGHLGGFSPLAVDELFFVNGGSGNCGCYSVSYQGSNVTIGSHDWD